MCNEKKRVLLTNFHPFGQGGGGHTTYIKTLIELNEREGYDIGVAVPATSITFKQLKDSGYPLLFSCDFPAKLKELGDVIRAIKRFRKIIREFSPSIVHTNGGADLSIVHWSYPLRKPYSIIRTHHSIKGLGQDFYHRHLYGNVVAHNIYVSSSAHKISSEMGLKPPRYTVISHGVNLDRFRPMEKDKSLISKYGLEEKIVFGSCAGLADCKRVDLIIKAASRLNKEFKFAILVVGNEEKGSRLQELANELEVSEFIYCGHTEDVRPFISVIDIGFILSDSAETISFAAREMLAMGKPLLSSSFSGLKENVNDGFNGLLTKPGSVDEIEAAMRRFLEMSKTKLESLSVNARQFAEEKFDYKNQIENHMLVYDNLS